MGIVTVITFRGHDVVDSPEGNDVSGAELVVEGGGSVRDVLQNAESAGLPGFWEQNLSKQSYCQDSSRGTALILGKPYNVDRQPEFALHVGPNVFHSLFGNDQANLARICMIALAQVFDAPPKSPNSTIFLTSNWILNCSAANGLEPITNVE